jgi:hypothetical protein
VFQDLVELQPSQQKELEARFASKTPSVAINGVICFGKKYQSAKLA